MKLSTDKRKEHEIAAMEAILAAHEQLEKRGNLSKTLQDVQRTIDLLQSARDAVASNPDTTALTVAKLKQPVKQSFDKLDDDLKEVNKGLNQYQKALDKRFKKTALPTASTEPLAEQPGLINRAIVMHLLREGKFEVANTLVAELNERAAVASRGDEQGQVTINDWIEELAQPQDADGGVEMGNTGKERGRLQKKFAEMYHILDALRNQHDLGPAIAWAREHSRELEQRGSNLEFELSRLKFVELYTNEDVMSDDPWEGPMRALEYAREVFPTFSTRYRHDSASLAGSLGFSPDLLASPYTTLFSTPSAWDATCQSFTHEFCALLSLPQTSPLYTACTAGTLALPILEKVERVMAATRGQWTSVNELPVETPLPREFMFHSVFVCPVSKEQGTDANPPMMLGCGHVIARESLEMHARGKMRVKCPYCPGEGRVGDAKRVFI